MAPNEHLLDNFSACNETRTLAGRLLREAQVKTATGSGHEIGELTAGLPAVCILIASERLNNGDVTKKAAQAAACLKPKDFSKVYTQVQAALGATNVSFTTYQQLYDKYKMTSLGTSLNPFFTKTENELRVLGTGSDLKSTFLRCVVFFWVCSTVKPRGLPRTEVFAAEQKIPVKKFVNLLQTLNDGCASLRTEIQSTIRQSRSPMKDASTSMTPRHTPRKSVPLRELPSKDTPKKIPPLSTPDEETPLRRSARKSALQEESPSKSSPPKRSSLAPHATIQSPSFRLRRKNESMRELPSKDSPKKRPVDDLQKSDGIDIDGTLPETPTKKRKIDYPSNSTLSLKPIFSPTPSSSRTAINVTPVKKRAEIANLSPSMPLSPLKRSLPVANATLDLYSSEESDAEDVPPRRFRPVYLDYKQWNARDPRLTRIWKRADDDDRTMRASVR